MKTVSYLTWSARVAHWNRLPPSEKIAASDQCQGEGHEWAECPAVVFCLRCLRVDLDREVAA